MQYAKDKLCNYCKRNGNGCGQMSQGMYGRSKYSNFEWDGEELHQAIDKMMLNTGDKIEITISKSNER